MWLACHNNEEIATATGVTDQTVINQAKEFLILESFPKLEKQLADYADPDFTPPVYNVWNFSKLTNEVRHPGNSEQTIVDNLISHL
jgi:hypothetical protein